jgi:predicted RNA-binding Zn ribbon-like protein
MKDSHRIVLGPGIEIGDPIPLKAIEEEGGLFHPEGPYTIVPLETLSTYWASKEPAPEMEVFPDPKTIARWRHTAFHFQESMRLGQSTNESELSQAKVHRREVAKQLYALGIASTHVEPLEQQTVPAPVEQAVERRRALAPRASRLIIIPGH